MIVLSLPFFRTSLYAMTTTTPSRKGYFALSKICSFTVNLTPQGWITMMLKKEVSKLATKQIFFSSKQLRDIMSLIPTVDEAVRERDAEGQEIQEFSTPKGDKRLVLFPLKGRLWVEVCTYSTPVYYSAEGVPNKKVKTNEDEMVKVKNQTFSLNMGEWRALKEKIGDIANYVTDLEMKGGSDDIASEGSRRAPMWRWRIYDVEAGSVKSSEYYYIQKQCSDDGESQMLTMGMKGRPTIGKTFVDTPTVDSAIRAAYIMRARELIQKSRRKDCEACLRGVPAEDMSHHNGCQRLWTDDATSRYQKIKDAIRENDIVNKIVSKFYMLINCKYMLGEVSVHKLLYDKELFDGIFAPVNTYEPALTKAMKFSKNMLAQDEEVDACDSDCPSDDENCDQNVTSDMMVQ